MARHCRPGNVVLIGGLARSGKSSFAGTLALLLRRTGQRALVISLDHWLRASAERLPGLLGRYDMPAAEQAVTDLAHGRPVRAPIYDAVNRDNLPDRLSFQMTPGDVLIVEGCPALLSQPLRDLASLRVYVGCAPKVRRARFEAEYRRRNTSPAEIDALYDAREADEHAPIRASAAFADHVITLADIAAS